MWLSRSELLASVGLAFEFAQSQTEHALQVGLFDTGDVHGSSKAEPELERCAPWGVREKLSNEKAALGFHLSGHLFEEVEVEIRQFLKTKLSDLTESREPQWVAGIVRDERFINTTKGKLHVFVLDDMSAAVEVTSDEVLFLKHKAMIKEDSLIIALVKAQTDRRNGGLRLSLVQVIDLSQARVRFGKYLSIKLSNQVPNFATLFKNHPPKLSLESNEASGLGIRLQLRSSKSEVEVQLGSSSIFYPNDEALEMISNQSGVQSARIIYD